MAVSNIRNILIGLAVLVAGYLFREQITGISELLFYLVVIVGAFMLLSGLYKFIQDKSTSESDREEKKRTLTQEVLLKTLARASYADTNIQEVEVEIIQKLYRDATGGDVSSADIRVAARADLYENQPFEKYLAEIQGELDHDDKCKIMEALSAVIKADGSISLFEVDFFNDVGKALRLAPADLAHLEESSSGSKESVEAAD